MSSLGTAVLNLVGVPAKFRHYGGEEALRTYRVLQSKRFKVLPVRVQLYYIENLYYTGTAYTAYTGTGVKIVLNLVLNLDLLYTRAKQIYFFWIRFEHDGSARSA